MFVKSKETCRIFVILNYAFVTTMNETFSIGKYYIVKTQLALITFRMMYLSLNKYNRSIYKSRFYLSCNS